MDKKQTFCEKVADIVRGKVGSTYQVETGEVCKENGILLHCISIIWPDINITPCYYVEDFTENWDDAEETADKILDAFHHTDDIPDFPIESVCNWEEVKDRIFVKVINTEQNEKLLTDVPSIKVLNLSVVFYLGGEFQDGAWTVLITNSHLSIWDKNVEDLCEQAVYNTVQKNPYELINMGKILEQMPFDFPDSDIRAREAEIPMYVLSNKQRLYGASAIVFTDILDNICDQFGRDIFILPSSMHELILIPTMTKSGAENLLAIVKEINEMEVLPKDFLADSVYYFNHELRQLEIAA